MVMPSAAIPAAPPLVTPTAPETNGPTASSEISSTDVSPDHPDAASEPARSAPEAERRQLTVMFCDLVGSTDLSGQLDPEDLRDVVCAYQETAAAVIQGYEGHIAQYLGDGLLIYFGFPIAHEDDAQRAIYTGLGIPEAMVALNGRLEATYGVQLAVRIGIHTGPVVVGEMGGRGRHENLALGETPNIAARLEGMAQPNTAVLSPVTAQLVQRSFILEELGPHDLKGVSEPMMLYTVVRPREVDQDDSDTLMTGGFETLVGRDEEIGLLLRRWEQSKEGLGQVVLLSGEAGIGKSSMVDGLRDHVHQAGFTRIAFRCSPYHTNSALYPIIEHIQRALGWQPEDSVDTQLAKLEQALASACLPLAEAVPLLASLLSLPLPEGRYAALNVSPQQQRQQTQDVLVAWLLEEAERQPVLAVWEDLHWADPSTLETLGLLVEQAPTATMLHVLTFRPEFEPPWPARSHLTPLTLNRLERLEVEALVQRLAGGKRLPEEVVAHIVGKTDGVPLYVEELTKMLLASDLLREETEQFVLTGPLLSVAIPDTLQDSLMARLDQMNTAKEVAQLGSVLGREFAYDMLQALAWQDETTLQTALAQLVQAELLYQRGRPPHARYLFKHALIQDAAYASLLRRMRQQYHQQMAQLLEARFPQVMETQPEMVAHHYTEAGLHDQAVVYWYQAGQRAAERSANAEAIVHLTKGLEVLRALPATSERAQRELMLHMALGNPMTATKGWMAAELEQAYTRAYALCQEVGEVKQRIPVLLGLAAYYHTRAEYRSARELEEEALNLAQQDRDETSLLGAHCFLGMTLCNLAELAAAHEHLEHAVQLYNPDQHQDLAFRDGQDPKVSALCWKARSLWLLGYPDQARFCSDELLAWSQALPHVHSRACALGFTAVLHQIRREYRQAQELAEALMVLSEEQGFTFWVEFGYLLRGWQHAMEQDHEGGIGRIQQSMAAYEDIGFGAWWPHFLSLIAEAYAHVGQVEAGLSVLAEASAVVNRTDERWWEAELYRLQGKLLVQTNRALSEKEAETCFLQAIAISRHQAAKSLELRAAISLAHLWQSQGKCQDAHNLLAPVYEWFTEGFDTVDLQDAQALLDELRARSNALYG
jgi:class 3 adenylate cyclase/predicted ATPase